MAKTIDNFKPGKKVKSIWSGDKFLILSIDRKKQKARLLKLSDKQQLTTNFNDNIYELDAEITD